jgi:hypothetical protein
MVVVQNFQESLVNLRLVNKSRLRVSWECDNYIPESCGHIAVHDLGLVYILAGLAVVAVVQRTLEVALIGPIGPVVTIASIV